MDDAAPPIWVYTQRLEGAGPEPSKGQIVADSARPQHETFVVCLFVKYLVRSLGDDICFNGFSAPQTHHSAPL